MIKYIRYLKFIGELLKYRVTEIAHPVLATICITNRCNLSCIYCYRDQSEKREFTTEELLKLIDFLVENGTRYISLNGGEPLLREDLNAIVDKIQQKNILCHLSTNGLLVRENISILKRIDSVALSLDGFKSSNDNNRGEGTYDKIVAAIKCLKKNKVKFYIHTVLTKNNINAVYELMSLSNIYGFRVQFSTLRSNSETNSIALSDSEIQSSIKEIIEYKKKKFPVFFSEQAYTRALNRKNPIDCVLTKLACHIESNGDVYPCIELVGKSRASNLFDVGIRKALKDLESIKCSTCSNICCIDLNYLFSFRPNVVLNALKNVI